MIGKQFGVARWQPPNWTVKLPSDPGLAHQTLRAALDWSYDLLSAPERAVLDRLSVIAADFDLGLVAELCAEPNQPPEDPRAVVTALARKSLVAVDTGGRDVRYRLLESTRTYAAERLAVSGAADVVMRRYAEATLRFFRDDGGSPERGGRDAWLGRHASRLDDARAVLEWAFSETGDRPLARELTAEISKFWLHLGLAKECLSWCRGAANPEPGNAPADLHEMRIQHALGVAYGATRGADLSNRSAISATIDLAERLGNPTTRSVASGRWPPSS